MTLVKKKFSMIFVLLYIAVSISLISGIVFLINQIATYRLNDEINQVININFQLSSLKTNLSDASLYFSSYINSDNEDYYLDYKESKQRVTNIILEIHSQVKHDEKSNMFYRTLNNMNEYEEKLSDQLREDNGRNGQAYKLGQDIKKFHIYMQQQCNYITEAYLQYQVESYKEIKDRHRKIQKSIYIGLVIMGIANYLYITRLIKSIVYGLNSFSKKAAQLAKGNWYVEDIKEQACMELDVFALAFNRMKNNIQQYIKDLELTSQLEKELFEQKLKNIKTDQLLKESQLLSLQNQMNPHFLFNTLNIISRTAMFDGNDKVVKLMESMAKILRYNLMNISNMVTLQEEIDIVRAYLYIQGERFQDQMSFEVNTDNIELATILTPPMILQPIVENSIKHGFKNKEEGGRIIIKVVQAQGGVQVIIEDNGEGIPQEELITIFEKKAKRCKEKCQVGLGNVKKRLELNFNQENLLQVASVEGQGVKIKIILPTQKE